MVQSDDPGVDGDVPCMARTTLIDLLRGRAADPSAPPLFRYRSGSNVVEHMAADVLDRAERWATALAARGVSAGDRVALVLPNGPDVFTMSFAIALVGAVEVPVNLEQRGVVLRHVLEDSEPVVLVVDPGWCRHVDECAYVGPCERVVWDDAGREQFSESEPASFEGPSPADLGLVMYTSGTTGHSKGVMLSHGYVARMAGTFKELCPGLGPGDVLYFCTPMFHIDSRMVLAATLDLGATVAFAPRFSASGFWVDVVEFEATFFLFVGAMLSILAKTSTPGIADGHRLRIATGAPIPEEAYPFFEDECGIRLVEVYGLTESVAVTWCTPDRRRRGSAGPSGSVFDVGVVDVDGLPVPPGHTGEIVFRPLGPDLVTLGYWRNQDATVAAFRDLWFHTGDLGRFDDDGFLWFVGRQKDMIRRRGENVSAFEVESSMAQMPGLLECAALSVPGDLGGEEEILLLVVASSDTYLDPSEVVRFARAHLARFAVPRWVGIVNELPHTPSGKLAKHAIERAPLTDYLDASTVRDGDDVERGRR